MDANLPYTVPVFILEKNCPGRITPVFLLLKDHINVTGAAGVIIVATIIPALPALWKMQETFSKDLNYTEQTA